MTKVYDEYMSGGGRTAVHVQFDAESNDGEQALEWVEHLKQAVAEATREKNNE